MPTPDVSVIIPTRNCKSEKQLAICFTLKSVLFQIGVDFEIIVVDNDSTDGTREAVSELAPQAIVVRANADTSNPAHLRNQGASRARGAILAFLDDDTLLTTADTLLRAVRAVQHYDFACGASRLWTSVYWWKCVRLDQPVSATLNTLRDISILPRGINREVGFRDLNEFTFIGNFGLIRKSVFEEVGGFDVEFRGWGLEDTDLMMRLCLAQRNFTILATHDISVFHLGHVSDSGRDFLANLARFNELERRRGCFFHINHFFGVYEADGYSLFSPVSPEGE